MSDVQALKKSYLDLFNEDGATDDEVTQIEARLGLTLPDDFRQIARFFGGGFLGGKSHHAVAVSGPATNIVEESLRLRDAVGLPRNMVVLAEPPESLIVMECRTDGTSAVVWCDAADVSRLARLDTLRGAQRWSSYGSFFEYLLEEERSERDESPEA